MLKPHRSWFGLLRVALLAALFGSGCTAVIARARIRLAQEAIAAAELDGAPAKAPYEYTSALLYLEKAREEESYSQFGPSLDYSRHARELAEDAQAVARGAPRPVREAASSPK